MSSFGRVVLIVRKQATDLLTVHPYGSKSSDSGEYTYENLKLGRRQTFAVSRTYGRASRNARLRSLPGFSLKRKTGSLAQVSGAAAAYAPRHER